MKKDRKEVEAALVDIISKLKRSRAKSHEADNILVELGMTSGSFIEIVKKPIDMIDGRDLFLLTKATYEVTGDGNINPERFFTDAEIRSAIRSASISSENDQETIKLPITIEKVLKISHESFVTKIKMSFLVEIFHAGLITYDYETQRSAKYRKSTDGVVPVPDVKISSVKNIAANMLNETYLEDTISLNVYSDKVEPITYNEKNLELVINEGAIISILDGFHRLQGGIRALGTNPHLQLEMLLSIRVYDTATAKRYFGQINTINPVKTERRRELLSDRPSDMVVADLQKRSELNKGKIASASNITEAANQLTTFDIMSYGIDKVFNPTTMIERKSVGDYLTEFFGYLTGYYVDEFLENPNKYRDSFSNPLSFLVYLLIAKKLQKEDIELSMLKEFIDANVDFKEERLNALINDARGINTKKVRNNLMNYVEELLGGDLIVK